MTHKHIDRINQKTMSEAVAEYTWGTELSKAEKAALNHVTGATDKPILDIGVGAGRTVAALREVSKDYIGVDYVSEMVEECKKKFPDVQFEQGDARNLISFNDNYFHTIMFSMNGISMVDHHGRLEILKEAYRLLRPGGVFLFSTYNKDNPIHKKLFRFPEFMFSFNPLKLGVRGIRYTYNLMIAMKNRFKFRKHEIHTSEYSMVNDVCHNYATMLYYISQSNQFAQLVSAGFDKNIVVFDLSGNIVNGDSSSGSLFYVARKPD